VRRALSPLLRLRAPPLVLFALLSASLHAGVFAAIRGRGSRVPAPTFDPVSPPLAGETLDLEWSAEAPGTEASETPAPSPAAAPFPTPAGATISPRLPSSSGRLHGLPDSPTAPAGGGARAALFGAVGVRYATDLATTFTRAFPQAASADPLWATAPFGNAGVADVTLSLDDAGHLAASAVAGSPSPALRRGVERTLALLGSRPFTARGAATKLRVVARVGRDDVHDGLHGEVFALSGGSFSGDVGTAFFALPASSGPGRRIDVELRLLP
jgi:hypothetical protein